MKILENKNVHKIITLMTIIGIYISFGTAAFAFTPLTNQVGLGESGVNVTNLQTFLSSNSSVYPQALITGYYGPLTQTAVDQFQIGYGLPPVGNVGPLTLQTIDSLINSNTPIDIDAPIIKNISVSVLGQMAQIGWNTDEASQGRLYYDVNPINTEEVSQARTTPEISGQLMSDNSLTFSKSMTLQNLNSNTTYYYVIEAMDAQNNVSIRLSGYFNTGLGNAGGQVPGQVSNVPAATYSY